METFLLGVRIKLWPLFQSEMGAHVESLKKLADSAAGTMLSRGNVRDTVVRAVSRASLIRICDSTEPHLGCSALCHFV